MTEQNKKKNYLKEKKHRHILQNEKKSPLEQIFAEAEIWRSKKRSKKYYKLMTEKQRTQSNILQIQE